MVHYGCPWKACDVKSSNHLLIVGGGLAGGLLALTLKSRGFENFTLFERTDRIGGHQTWSFHKSDVSAWMFQLLSPLLVGQWRGYDVIFPSLQRQIQNGYCTIRSELLHNHLTQILKPEQVSLGSEVTLLGPEMVQAGNIRKIGTVIDARSSNQLRVPCAFQKFVGLDIEFAKPHGLTRPIVMDSTVEQKEGFRFFYVLPLTPTTALIEDTRYSENPQREFADFESEIIQYSENLGGSIKNILRQESAALPLPLKRWPDPVSLRIGLSAGFFHFSTGYSIPTAARVAEVLSMAAITGDLYLHYQEVKRHLFSQNAFFIKLNRMVFGAALPIERRIIFEQFYSRPEDLISRFYALNLRAQDRLRLLWGRPPVSVTQAVKSIVTDSWMMG